MIGMQYLYVRGCKSLHIKH